MSLYNKVAYNTLVQIISKVIATVLGLFTIAIMTRYLGQVGFGQYTTAITFLSFFAILADLGLTLVTVQMISQPNVNENKILNNLFGLRFLTALIFLGLAPLAVIFFPYSNEVKISVAVVVLSFLFTALNQVLVGLFQKKLRMDKVSIAEIVSRVFLFLGVLLVLKYDLGLIGIMWATVISGLVNFLLHFIFSYKFVRIKLEFDFKIWQDILKKTWPMAITIAFNLIYLKADTLILSLMKSESEVGIYGATYKVIDVLVTIPFMFAGIILPIMTSSWIEEKKDYFQHILQKCFDFMAILAVPLIVGTQFTADKIMVLVAGDEFLASGLVLRILIIAAAIIFLGCMFSHAVIALDKQKEIIGAYVFTSVTALIGYFVYIYYYSYIGAAWMTIYSEAVIALASVYFVWKYSGFLPRLNKFFKSVLASLVMALFLYYLPDYNSIWALCLVLISASSVYFVAIFLLKGISREDVAELFKG